jgi:hypothetical protein
LSLPALQKTKALQKRRKGNDYSQNSKEDSDWWEGDEEKRENSA